MFCQVKIVSDIDIVPLISYNSAGIEAFVAINNAAEEESPSAQTVPKPRKPAAPIAR